METKTICIFENESDLCEFVKTKFQIPEIENMGCLLAIKIAEDDNPKLQLYYVSTGGCINDDFPYGDYRTPEKEWIEVLSLEHANQYDGKGEYDLQVYKTNIFVPQEMYFAAGI